VAERTPEAGRRVRAPADRLPSAPRTARRHVRNKFLKTGEPGWHPLRKIRVALRGLRLALVHDPSVLYKVLLSVPVLVLSIYYHRWVDSALVLVVSALMLAAELFNTAVEALCDIIQPDEDTRVGLIKDIAAAATGITIAVWFIIVALEAAKVVRYWMVS
jgi:diacylglycerol kinase